MAVTIGVLAVIGLMIAAVTAHPWSNNTGSLPTGVPHPVTTQLPAPAPALTSAQLLSQQLASDQPAVEATVGTWVPQLSSKKVGLVADGITYGNDTILRNYQSIKTHFPDALLLTSGQYSSYGRSTNFYVVIEPLSFGSAADTIAWCVAQNLGRNDCAATRLSHTDGSQGSVVYQK